VFQVYGDQLMVVAMPTPVHRFANDGARWTPEAIARALDGRLLDPPAIPDFVEGLS
jgi:hypothetical protein